jgi:putative phosphoesterase
LKVAVVSDSHDNLEKITEFARAVEREGVELVIHCGDFVSPFALKHLLSLLKCDFIGVFGNNDGEVAGLLKVSGGSLEKPPVSKLIGGVRFAIMHEPVFVDSVAVSGDFDFVLYGHTHRIDTRIVGSCQVLNPGELCGYLTGKSTYAVVDTSEVTAVVRVLK